MLGGWVRETVELVDSASVVGPALLYYDPSLGFEAHHGGWPARRIVATKDGISIVCCGLVLSSENDLNLFLRMLSQVASDAQFLQTGSGKRARMPKVNSQRYAALVDSDEHGVYIGVREIILANPETVDDLSTAVVHAWWRRTEHRSSDSGTHGRCSENGDRAPERVRVLDAARGVALLGVVVSNLAFGFRTARTYAPGVAPAATLSMMDRIIKDLLLILVAEKAMTMFSILFGIGLAAFAEREVRRRANATVSLSRRLCVLLAIGLIHTILLWEGDILASYAVAGLVAICFLRAPLWLVAALGCALPVSHPLLMLFWPEVLPQAGPAAVAHYHHALEVYQHGSWSEVVALRVGDLGARAHFFAVRSLGGIFANMLVGVALWRSGILATVDSHRRTLVRIAVAGIALGATCAIYRVLIEQVAVPPPPSPLRRLWWNLTLQPFALGYGAALLLLFQHWRRLSGLMAATGRMALSNYLMQSIVFTTALYGYGLGLFGKVDQLGAVGMAVALYALQVIFSEMWLRRFRLGPVEWVWRSLARGTPQLMMKNVWRAGAGKG